MVVAAASDRGGGLFPSPMNSRQKGARGERELAGVLAEFGWPARRGQQRSGVDQADVIDGPPGIHFECKRVESLNVWAAYAQAQRDAPNDHTPVVAMRRNKSPWLAVVDLRTLLRLLGGEPSVEKHLAALLGGVDCAT